MLSHPLNALIKLQNVAVDYPLIGESTALKNVNFAIYPGDAIGLVGPNGAEKSTLLRLLSGVLKPRYGIIETQAKIASLLSSQAGMFVEATGLENTRMLATMKQIPLHKRQQFIEEVTALSGLETYMHLPLRTYSTSMRFRLSFAIEILSDIDVIILEEHIGTADITFREYMLNCIKTFIKAKKALIVASHSEDLIADLCTKMVTLKNGQLSETP